MTHQVGIVVPTLGLRGPLLEECLRSIRASGSAFILLVGPSGLDVSKLKSHGLIDAFTHDPNMGVSEAINKGIRNLPEQVKFVNWIGDDDVLLSGSLELCRQTLDQDQNLVMVFGGCGYIDPDGRKLWTNTPGAWAVSLLRFGPDLIPQPGALFRRDIFEKVGGLDQKLRFAFDFDLFIKLSKEGKFFCINQTLANFRWHPHSLSVGQRGESVKEASLVRLRHLPFLVRPIALFWEPIVMGLTLLAGAIMNLRANNIARKA